ncbi:DUF7535 family protein [Natrialbaceae archaeon AArc-T1-2]|uniref:DUF7535 family protein n=1 Tax=Natrialbaceae archaeon AArc-T1-2 TaxID=3053904 RepID=UPI00255ADD51|nr:hypothetical protein [Natrialbaceae archaeon AArc-T1-2]WIV66108.1 hypothetical protein QQ977_10425 [Natrialbaceae archaeon AArc-T1-2]
MTGTVTDPTPYKPTAEMSVFGYVIAIGIAIVLFPLLPALFVLWLVVRLFGRDRSREAGRERERSES